MSGVAASDGNLCPHLSGCPMFPLFNMQSALQIWKISYCTSKFVECERYRRSERGEPVPDNLMPSGALLRKPGNPR